MEKIKASLFVVEKLRHHLKSNNLFENFQSGNSLLFYIYVYLKI